MKYYLSNLDLDTRVVDLEENGGSDGNSSVAELEVRVETLEGTAADHETRISGVETDINGKRFLFYNLRFFVMKNCTEKSHISIIEIIS